MSPFSLDTAIVMWQDGCMDQDNLRESSYLHDYTLVVIDVETSWLCPRTHSLLEVGLVPVGGEL